MDRLALGDLIGEAEDVLLLENLGAWLCQLDGHVPDGRVGGSPFPGSALYAECLCGRCGAVVGEAQ